MCSLLFVRSTLQRNARDANDEVKMDANPAYEGVEFDGKTLKCK